MQLVRQKHRMGCVIASLAMVLDLPYENVLADFGGKVGKGFIWIQWHTYLAARGYAVQSFFDHDPVAEKKRPIWPLSPWADVHLCEVDAGGRGTHLVVLLRDGSVLDPESDEPKRLSDYASVILMSAVWPAAKPS